MGAFSAIVAIVAEVGGEGSLVSSLTREAGTRVALSRAGHFTPLVLCRVISSLLGVIEKVLSEGLIRSKRLSTLKL